MRRVRADVVWFGMALLLLAAGIVGWSSAGSEAGGYGYGTAGSLMVAVWSSGAIILLTWWRRSADPDSFDAPFMGTLALAASAPLSMLSLVHLTSWTTVVAGVAAGLAALPLGWQLAGRMDDHRSQRRARLVVLVAGVGAAWYGWQMGIGDADPNPARTIRWLLVSGSVAVPAVMLATATLSGTRVGAAPAARRVVEALTVLGLGAAPAVTGLALQLDQWQVLLLPAIAVLVTLLILGRYAVQPLTGVAGAAQSQRDRVVAAAEAERTRLAQVLHDGPLADITLLIQRLDDRGDEDSAAVARSVADELRAIGSELWLPVLEDLGTGPALEWLVGRLSRRSGAHIELVRSTTVRPPIEVERATYRVAQEALVNALKHGLPPIRVWYHATTADVVLVVDDQGSGLGRDALGQAERDGHLGLASMIQRAEAIGARLDLAGQPEGGTRVSLTWRAASPGGVPATRSTGPAPTPLPSAAGVVTARR